MDREISCAVSGETSFSTISRPKSMAGPAADAAIRILDAFVIASLAESALAAMNWVNRDRVSGPRWRDGPAARRMTDT